MNVTQDRGDKRFSSYPKTTPLFQPGEGFSSTQMTELSILIKPGINKSIRVADPPALVTRTTFHQQGTSAFQNRNRSQSPINKSQNRSRVNQTTPQVIYQPVQSSWASDLPKLKLTEFSGDPPEWPEWSGLFHVNHQNQNQWYGKDAKPEDQSYGSSKSSNIGNGIQLTTVLLCMGYTLWEVW